MDDLRSQVRALHTSGMPADMVVDLIITVVTAAVRAAGGRPRKEGPAQPLATAAPPPAVSHDVGQKVEIDQRDLFENPAERSAATVLGSGSESSLVPFPDPSQRSVSDRRSDEPAPPGFRDFYAMYPRKRAPHRALAAWKALAAKRALPPLEVLMTALIWQVEEWDANATPDEKIPHPATWLNGRYWLNERPAPRRPAVHPKDRAAYDLVKEGFPGK